MPNMERARARARKGKVKIGGEVSSSLVVRSTIII